VCARLTHLGVHIDEHRNARAGPAGHGVISTPDSPVTVRVVPADENIVIARHTVRLDARRNADHGGTQPRS
jgi:acetate kinase